MIDHPQGRRAVVLRMLVEGATPVGDLVAELAGLGTGGAGEILTLTCADALRMLEGYVGGALTSDDAVQWARALRNRHDVVLEEGDAPVLRAFLFETATPEKFHPFSASWVARWRHRLGGGALRPAVEPLT